MMDLIKKRIPRFWEWGNQVSQKPGDLPQIPQIGCLCLTYVFFPPLEFELMWVKTLSALFTSVSLTTDSK